MRLLAYEKLRRWLDGVPDRPLLAAQAYHEIRLGAQMLRGGAPIEGLRLFGSGVARSFPGHWTDLAQLLLPWLLASAQRRAPGGRAASKASRPRFSDLLPDQEHATEARPRMPELMQALGAEDLRLAADGAYRFARVPAAVGLGLA